jgi:hypothetical protein
MFLWSRWETSGFCQGSEAMSRNNTILASHGVKAYTGCSIMDRYAMADMDKGTSGIIVAVVGVLGTIASIEITHPSKPGEGAAIIITVGIIVLLVLITIATFVVSARIRSIEAGIATPASAPYTPSSNGNRARAKLQNPIFDALGNRLLGLFVFTSCVLLAVMVIVMVIFYNDLSTKVFILGLLLNALFLFLVFWGWNELKSFPV